MRSGSCADFSTPATACSSMPCPAQGIDNCISAPRSLRLRNRKPARRLEYWEGPVKRDTRHKMILCFGPADIQSHHQRCHHNSRLRLSDLTVGFVDAIGPS